MRIKFNDKIYRLEEIESGVDSLMELVEEYKDGDFLHSDWNGENITIIYRKRNCIRLYYHASKSNLIGLDFDKEGFWSDGGDFRLATESEKKELIDALAEVGKRWNTEKKCIEYISVYKDGDFVVNDSNSILIFKEADGDCIFDHAYLREYGQLFINKNASYDGIKRHATIEEKYRMIDALAERGKRWNAEKKCIENIPKRKFKAGDKVRIKDGVSSKTHGGVYPYFEDFLDQYRVMTVKKYITTDIGEYITTSEAKRGDHHYGFAEDWLEPWSDEPKVGDWVIAWNNDMSLAVIGIKIDANPAQACKHVLNNNNSYKHAIKFDGTKEHLEKIRKG